MSKYVIVLAITVAAVLGYDEKYDKVDVDKIIGDEQLFNSYVDCMLDKAPCTVEHSGDFRKILPEVIETACEKCSEIQKKNVRKSVKALQEKKPAAFVEFQQKYDPEGKYIEKFSAFLLASE